VHLSCTPGAEPLRSVSVAAMAAWTPNPEEREPMSGTSEDASGSAASAAAAPRRLAVVTGAAQGLGLAIAERLAHDGMTVVIADVQHDAACTAARHLGAGAVALPLDVADERSVAELYAEVDRRFGRLDVLVNNAAVSGPRTPIESLPLADFERTVGINLTGTFLMCRRAIALMRLQGWGRIVNISSLSARTRNGVHSAHYAASKAGVIGLSRVLADEVGREGITVNCVAPSRIVTGMTRAIAGGDPAYFEQGAARTAVGRIGQPADVAHVVAWLCSEQAGFITGTVMDVNGGTFMP
jgi:3-oxoacyl-[acyl-carrier protein] reductase